MISAFVARNKLRQISKLMDEERNVLLSGPLLLLDDIIARRTVILNALENGGPVSRAVLGDGLTNIRQQAARNKKLFKASINGMRAATKTIKAIELNLGAMETYTSSGQKITVLSKPSIKDHRV